VIKGKLNIVADKSIKARNVQVWIEGKEHAVVTRDETVIHHDDEHGDTTSTEVHVYSQTRMIVEGGLDLWTPENQKIDGPCEKQCPFEFSLPPDALPTLEMPFEYDVPKSLASKGITRSIPKNLGGTINYKIRAKIDKPFAFDPNDEIAVRVHPVSENVETGKLSSKIASTSGKTELNVQIDKDVFMPGENITGNIELRTHPKEKVRGVSALLGFCYSCTAQRETDTYLQVIDQVSFLADPAVEYFTQPFSFATPPNVPCSIAGQLVKIEWFVDVKVDLPLKADMHLRFPLRAIPTMMNQ